MNNEVLVTFMNKRLIENMLAYIEKTVQPGTRVVFVIPYSGDGFGGASQDQPATL